MAIQKKQDRDIPEDYCWEEDGEFVKLLYINCCKNLVNIIARHKITNMTTVYLIRDWKKNDVWRVRADKEYKKNRNGIIKHQGQKIQVKGLMEKLYTNWIPAMLKRFPLKFIHLRGAEADDVIGILTQHLHLEYTIYIVSSDSDFFQLFQYPDVHISDIRGKNMLEKFTQQTGCFLAWRNGNLTPEQLQELAKKYLQYKTVIGDKSDNISPCIRGIAFTELDNALREIGEDDELYRKYQDNKRLIDFNRVPKNIKDSILETI